MSPQSHYILLENLKFSDAEKTSFQLEEIDQPSSGISAELFHHGLC